MDPEALRAWLGAKPKAPAIICDIDDTLCTLFDCPIAPAVECLTQIDRSVEVHYVTARPSASREGTEKFLLEHRLPGWRNLHFCPSWQASRQHKAEVIAELARLHRVLVSVGDHDEEEQASRAAGIPFVRVTTDNAFEAWAEVARLVRCSLHPPDADLSDT